MALPSGLIPRRTKGNTSFAPAHTKRKSNGSWRAVIPTPAYFSNIEYYCWRFSDEVTYSISVDSSNGDFATPKNSKGDSSSIISMG